MKLFLAGTSLATKYGGPAYSVSRLADALAEAGVSVGLWAPDGSSLTTSLLPDATTVTRLAGSAGDAVATFGTPDVIHDNGIWMPHNHGLARIARKRGIPRVVSTRGMLEPWAMRHKRFKKEIAWRVYQRRDLDAASWLHATSDVEAENLAVHGLTSPIGLIPNGVDIPRKTTDHLSRDADTVRTALFLGRIYPVKGLPMLIDAWGQVMPRNWRLAIAGPDEAGHLDDVKKVVATYGLESVISFPGAVAGDAKRSLFENADIFILPSHSESFGMAIAEALSYGVPVLTTTAAPWPDLDDLKCGWRVRPTPSDLAAALREATSVDQQTLSSMGARGRELVSARFQWKNIAQQFIARYEATK